MAVVKQLLRAETDGTLSFGNYELAEKSKLSDFEHKGDLYKDSAISSEIITRILWGDLPNISYNGISQSDLAKIYSERALYDYAVIANPNIKDNGMLGIAALDMYKLTKEVKYLDFAKYLFNLKFETNDVNPYNLIYQALLGNNLKVLTNDKQYDVVKILIDKIIEHGYEKRDNKENAFKGSGFYYYVSENSLIIGLLSNLLWKLP